MKMSGHSNSLSTSMVAPSLSHERKLARILKDPIIFCLNYLLKKKSKWIKNWIGNNQTAEGKILGNIQKYN